MSRRAAVPAVEQSALFGPAVRVPSPEEVEAAMTPGGGWSRATLAGWGVSWPPPRGWRRELKRRFAEQQAVSS